MRLVLVAMLVVACRGPVAPTPPADPDIIAMSHAVLDAADRGDVAAVQAQLGTRYVHFEGKYADAQKDLAAIKERAASKDPADQIASRTWSDERVFARGTDAVFVGKAREKQAGNEIHGDYEDKGWYTLVWSRDGDRWKLVYRGWQVAGSQADTQVWNHIFENKLGFEKKPNKLLVEYAAKHAPGTAVDVAMGQGRNALYLASVGWKVTGVDFSDEGVKQARTDAAAKKLELEAVVSDVKTYDYGVEKWDLVAMIYAYPAFSKIADLQRATKPGGLFVYEFFADPDSAPTPPLAQQFATGWEVLKDETVEDVPDWRADRAKIQRFVARKK
jgi:ubiquinone/menaquinone biosynthesis C-methylase UbiE